MRGVCADNAEIAKLNIRKFCRAIAYVEQRPVRTRFVIDHRGMANGASNNSTLLADGNPSDYTINARLTKDNIDLSGYGVDRAIDCRTIIARTIARCATHFWEDKVADGLAEGYRSGATAV